MSAGWRLFHVVDLGAPGQDDLHGLIVNTYMGKLAMVILHVSVRSWITRRVAFDYDRRVVSCRPVHRFALMWVRPVVERESWRVRWGLGRLVFWHGIQTPPQARQAAQ